MPQLNKNSEEFKLLVHKQIKQFVYKYQRRYYPHFTGEIDDLVSDIFTEFCQKKKHRNGETFSELDRVDVSKVGNGFWTGSEEKALATYTQRFVMHTLIDYERKDKQEVSATENYEEGSGKATLDRLARVRGNRNIDGEDVGGAYQENINYKFYDLMDNPIALKRAKQGLINNPEQIGYILYLLKHYIDKLDADVVKFIVKMVEDVYLRTPEEAQIANEKKLKNAASVLPTNLAEELLSLVPEEPEQETLELGNAKFHIYKLQGRAAAKVEPNGEDTNEIINYMTDHDYSLYRNFRGLLYFFKN